MRTYGFSVIHLEEVDSTNNYLAERFDELADRTLVRADIQLAGRGRAQHKWESHLRGNLYMSLLIKDRRALAAGHPAHFTQLMALAARRACAKLGVTVGVKWPNDLFVAENKIGGILSESRYAGTNYKGVIVGIGLNVAASPRLSSAAKYGTTSIAEERDSHEVSVEKILETLLRAYTELYPAVLEQGFGALADEYRDALLFTERLLRIEQDGYSANYRFAGIGPTGELKLRREDGTAVTVNAGEVAWIP